jgi:hypothetical protein
MIAVTKISDGEDGGIEVRGKALQFKDFGLYVVRLIDMNSRKELHKIDAEKIEYDPNTQNFIAFVDINETIASSEKMIEFYVRNNPQTIEYKYPPSPFLIH